MTAALSLLVTVAAQQLQQYGGMLQHHSNDCIVEMRENVFVLLYRRVGNGGGKGVTLSPLILPHR